LELPGTENLHEESLAGGELIALSLL